MRKVLTILTAILFLFAGRSASAEEQYNIGLTITPYTGRENGLQEDISYEVKMSSGDSVSIDLRIFQAVMTIEKKGEEMVFTFDHDLEMLSGRAVIETHRIILEKNASAHLRTPDMDTGAWLAVSWGSDDIPLIYQDFIKSISSIYAGNESGRYGSYEDYSIMFNIQSTRSPEEKTLGYAVFDLNDDGTEELLFGDMNTDTTGTPLYDLYTIKHGELIHVFDVWDRNRYYLTTDGGFIRHGSDSAFSSFSSIYIYEGGELVLLRSVIYNSEKDKDNPWFLSYTKEYDTSGALPIAQDEAQKILSFYIGTEITLTPFGN